MIYGNIIALLLFIICLLTHSFSVRKNIEDIRSQLREINEDIEENRYVTLSVPEKSFESMLEEINRTLSAVRENRTKYVKKEKEFKRQIENISHDMRTPLTSMLGYLKMMDVSSLSSEEQEDIKTVIRKTECLQELIAQFYDYSRLTAGDYSMTVEPVDISKYLKMALADAHSELSDKNLDVNINIPEEACFVSANESAVKRVFQNLLQNVGRYAKKSLEVHVKRDEKHTTVSFINDIVDVSKQDAERMFDRFYTMDTSRTTGSTGLGLTIVKELVEKMNGRIEAEIRMDKLYIRVRFDNRQ